MSPSFSNLRGVLFALLVTVGGPVWAQGTSLAFGGGTAPDAPVEVQADSLSVDQTDGSAVFEGNVVVIQQDMRLTATRLLVTYNEAGDRVKTLEATGGVTLVSGEDAAEAERAEYDIDSGNVVMQGDVLVVQGTATIAGQTLNLNLQDGTARMEGRVRTILQNGGGQN